jgi:hypothetical protein
LPADRGSALGLPPGAQRLEAFVALEVNCEQQNKVGLDLLAVQLLERVEHRGGHVVALGRERDEGLSGTAAQVRRGGLQ